jgi:hypothetical protein
MRFFLLNGTKSHTKIMSTSQTTIDPTLFGAYDVRGIYGEKLTEDAAYLIGRAAAQYLNVPQIAVGRDMRLRSRLRSSGASPSKVWMLLISTSPPPMASISQSASFIMTLAL